MSEEKKFKEKAEAPLFLKAVLTRCRSLNLIEKRKRLSIFSLKTDPSIFKSIAPELLDNSNESMLYFPHHNRQAGSCPSL